MSKRKILTFALSVFATVLTACDPGTDPESKGITFDDLNVASNYIASKEFYVDSNGNQAYTATHISGDPNTLGDVGVFVLPVEFEDAPASELPGGADFHKSRSPLHQSPAAVHSCAWKRQKSAAGTHPRLYPGPLQPSQRLPVLSPL